MVSNIALQLAQGSGDPYGGYNPVNPYANQYQNVANPYQNVAAPYGTRSNPRIIPAVQVRPPISPVGMDLSTGQRGIPLATASGMYDLGPNEVVVDGKVVSKDAVTGLPGVAAGVWDWITGDRYDVDKKGSSKTAAQGGLGRTPTLSKEALEAARDVAAVDTPGTYGVPMLSPGQVQDLINRDNQYLMGTLGTRLAGQQAQRDLYFRNMQRDLGALQNRLLSARAAVERLAGPRQQRMGMASDAVYKDRLSMAAMQNAASNLVAATAPRSFGALSNRSSA